MTGEIVQVKRLRTVAAFRERLQLLGLADQMGCDDDVDANGPLSTSFTVTDGTAGSRTIGNRFCALAMEGWDATSDGRPTELVRRRWQRFGASGAKLIWGGEAAAVTPEGRANPHQLVMNAATVGDIAALRGDLVAAHIEHVGTADDLMIGLQLTHSGRWCRPVDVAVPRAARTHAVLDRRAPNGAVHVLSDAELDELVAAYIVAARHSHEAGFDFVDIKHCHGYLLHELLGSVDREGPYGGSFANRTAFLRKVVDGIRADVPELTIGVRLSAYDLVPFAAGPDGIGEPQDLDERSFCFGGDGSGVGVDLTEAHRFLELCQELGIGMVCMTAGSPYYNPHVQRPAYFAPSDGYAPPEDPLVGVARMINAAADLARSHPEIAIVGSGYSYLQQWLPNVGQHVVRTGGAASIGIGRNMLSYPGLPSDVLAGRPLRTSEVCRTFSDCTTAPRNGLISGCFPLDPFYKAMPARVQLAGIKRATGRKVRR